ncbi:MAG: thiolase family protein [bacterium]|nr:thiolase family protein [bacterium]
MDRKVAIVGYKQTKYLEQNENPRERMVMNLVQSLLQDMKITRDDIGTFILSCSDFQDGRTISECFMIPWVGAYMKDVSKVDSDSANAVLYAMMRILSGNYETALVVSWAMGGSEFRSPRVMDFELDPIYERQAKLVNEITAAALQAQAYMAKSKLTEEQLAALAVKNLRNGARNPLALRKKADATAKDILSSRPLASPLRELHAYTPADGACAVLLASEEKARELTKNPVWIKGVGFCQDTYYLGERDLVKMDSLQKAAKTAYKMAGITDPAKKIGVSELHTTFVSQEPIFAEALGLIPKNAGPNAVSKGALEIEGKTPINPSGGPQAANPLMVSGLIRIAEACTQLRGEAGEHQVKKTPRLALAHGQIGMAAQHNVVFVLGN